MTATASTGLGAPRYVRNMHRKGLSNTGGSFRSDSDFNDGVTAGSIQTLKGFNLERITEKKEKKIFLVPGGRAKVA